MVLFNIFLLIFPQIVLTASRGGLLLWFNNVLPTLLPFMVATNMLIALGFAEFFERLTAPIMKKLFGLPGAAGFGFLAGLTSGYPVGAKTVADLHRNGRLSTIDAQHLLAFCNNAGPLFIVGVVGVGMLGNARLGYVLWGTHIFSAVLVGILLGIKKRKLPHETAVLPENAKICPEKMRNAFKENVPANVDSERSVGKVLGSAVKSSMDAMVVIGGLIIFFNVVLAIIEEIVNRFELPLGEFFHYIAGLVEVTSGARRLSALAHSENLPLVVATMAFIIAFGGLSIHAQTFHFTAGTGIKNGRYILAKILHGIFAAGLTVLIMKFFGGGVVF